jgi:hypothetical protein
MDKTAWKSFSKPRPWIEVIGDKLSLFKDDDDGIPPCCRGKPGCPLSKESFINNNKCCMKYVGEFGLKYFDRKRKIILGIASMFTLFAMVLTTWGCFALSPVENIVRRTHWAAAEGVDSNGSFSLFIGLRTFVYVDCAWEFGIYKDTCKSTTVYYNSDECSEGNYADACSACQNVASSVYVSAITNCIGLILAFNGAQVRMRPIGDVVIQKLLGMIADGITFIVLIASLVDFQTQCLSNLNDAYNSNDTVTNFTSWVGPGIYCYYICAVSALLRAIAHILTPLPGFGVEISIANGLDNDKDTKIIIHSDRYLHTKDKNNKVLPTTDDVVDKNENL